MGRRHLERHHLSIIRSMKKHIPPAPQRPVPSPGITAPEARLSQAPPLSQGRNRRYYCPHSAARSLPNVTKPPRTQRGAHRTLQTLPARSAEQTERYKPSPHAARSLPNVTKPPRTQRGANRTLQNLPARSEEPTERYKTSPPAARSKPNVTKPPRPQRGANRISFFK